MPGSTVWWDASRRKATETYSTSLLSNTCFPPKKNYLLLIKSDYLFIDIDF